MPADETPKPKFQPPPWEAEAFERFQQEKTASRSEEELDAALASIRQGDQGAQQPPAVLAPAAPASRAPEAEEPPTAATPAAGPMPTTGMVPEARIEEMLAELRREEPSAGKASPALVYSAVAFMGSLGVFVIVESLVLFSKTKTAEPSAMALLSMTSLVMVAAGVGCIAAAVALFRKYHS